MSIFLWFSGILTLLVYLIYKFFQRNADFWKKRGFTFLGSEATGSALWNFWNKTLPFYVDLKMYKYAKELRKPIFGFIEFSSPVAFLLDLDLIKNIFIKDFDSFMNRRLITLEKADPLFHKTLLLMEGERWRELRGKMSPTFTTGKIKRMFGVFQSSSTKLVKYLEKQSAESEGLVDFSDGWQRYAMDVIASAAFGLDSRAFVEDDPIFTRMGKKLSIKLTFKLLVTFIVMTVAPRMVSVLGLGISDKKSEAFFTQVIKSAIKQREESGEKRDDFLQLMLDARNGQLKIEGIEELEAFEKEAVLKVVSVKEDKVILSDDVIIAQSVLFILAGFDTTQSLLLFAVYELALCPHVQEKLAKEVQKARQAGGGKFTYENINQLEYLDKVINETLRKYPPAPRLERRTTSDYRVPGTDLVIPKDVLVAIPTFAIQRDAEYFPEPEVFDPERWSAEERNKRHPMTFQPFGHGPRNCIGMRFAQTNVKMALANLVDQFVLEPSAKTLIPMKFANTNSLKPEGGMTLKVKPRIH